MTTRTNNLSEIQTTVAQRLLETIPTYVSERSHESLLRNIGRGFDEPFGRRMYLEYEMERPVRASCTLTVGFEHTDYTPEQDEEGNLWYEYKLVVQINYPCHGSESVAVVRERAALIEAVCKIGDQLDFLVQGISIHAIYKTAAEVKADEDERTAKRAQATVDGAKVPNYMRVGHISYVPATAEWLQMPEGLWTTKRGEKTFTARVHTIDEAGTVAVTWTRVS